MFVEESLKDKAEKYFNMGHRHMGHTLDIKFQHISRDKVVASMPVDHRTIQPFGILHGGASVVLAETLMSVGGWFLLESTNKAVVGVEINANHIRSVKKGGIVIGTAVPVHTGNRIQVWETTIRDEQDKIVCTSRCTLAIVNR